jgi:hypothetical protein
MHISLLQVDNILCMTATPKVSQLRIVGDICEGSKVAVSAMVSGGVEGASRVQWFKTNIPDESLGDANLEAISTAKVSKVGCNTCLCINSRLIHLRYSS